MYKYEDFKEWLSTIQGTEAIIKGVEILNHIKYELKRDFFLHSEFSCTCDTWNNWAVINRLEEMKKIVKIADGTTVSTDTYRIIL